MVAIYTGDGHKKQTQNLASSVDRGRTWAKFAGNPVLDLNSNSFRDPKVFWHEPTGRWIMATVLADERKVRLWGSADLKTLGEAERLRPRRLGEGRLGMPRAVRGPGRRRGTAESRWVLKVDVNDGAPFGGSGGQYFVGRFDGKEFRPEETKADAPLWIDFGKDFYAVADLERRPGRPAGLDRLDEQLAICQRHPDLPLARGHDDPADRGAPQDAGRPPPGPVAGRGAAGPPRPAPRASRPAPIPAGRDEARRRRGRGPGPGDHRRIRAAATPTTFGLKVRRGDGEETVIGVDRRAGEVFVDRTRSGAVGFSPHFPGRHSARLAIGRRPSNPSGSTCSSTRRPWRSSPTDGRVVLTDQIFPQVQPRREPLRNGGTARLRSLEAWELRP